MTFSKMVFLKSVDKENVILKDEGTCVGFVETSLKYKNGKYVCMCVCVEMCVCVCACWVST